VVLEPHDVRGLRDSISDTGPIVPSSGFGIKIMCGIRIQHRRH
jgi:hypothetical protein